MNRQHVEQLTKITALAVATGLGVALALLVLGVLLVITG